MNKFYSIMTILNYLPDIEYKFFNDIDIYNIISKYSIIFNLYNNINDINSKIDLFRTWYLYNNGGIYFNCKNILYSHINNLLDLDEFYVNDLKEKNIYCNFVFNKYTNNNNTKVYLINICYNIFNSVYYNYLSITSSELLGQIINNGLLDLSLNSIDNKIIKYNDKILIKLSYNSYYNNYESSMNKSFILWKNNLLYNKFIINYNNINYIDHIVWINLDRSENRRKYMENLLQNIDIPNTRISAIDGKYIDLSILNSLERPLTNYEKAVTLSHIKAINYLKEIDGNYFCVCEDDITLNNTLLFNYDLKHIINNAPKFDILLLSKTYNHKLNNLYTKWNNDIYGAVCYIISREGIDKLTRIAKYDQYNSSFNVTTLLSIADWFLYNNTNTYVYKYNFIASLDEESIIHPDHLNIHKNSSIYQLSSIIEDFIDINN